ncbi:MAG: family 10 glycosylhydrolase [Bacteroidota bacterium]
MSKFCIKIFLTIYISFSAFFVKAQLIPDEEFRAVWVTTAFNIDWPSSPKLNSDRQKQEFISLLDEHKSYGINAVFVQVKPSGEVFWPSKHEPWSHWLTGEQGKAPNPYYDPLQFMIDECHKRNIEFHAWINPFRSVSNIARVKPVSDHITRKHPEWFISYGGDIIKKYLNPGIPKARAYVINVIMEIVHNYEIDGIHFDDYFYPMKQNGKNFPDYNTYLTYNPHSLTKADWRRENINWFIHDLSDSITHVKPKIKFGVGPGGIWRNKSHDPGGSQTRGLSSYDALYADVLLWLREGWIDYVAPQIYWNIGYSRADYHELVDWWSRHTYGKHLYIGQGAHRINSTRSWQNPSEIPNQIRLNRTYPEVKGSVFYSSKSMLSNLNGIKDSLRNNLYTTSANTPKMAWKTEEAHINIVAIEASTDTAITRIKLKRLPQPRTPIKISTTKLRKEILLSWKMDKSQKKFLADTNSCYRIYRFKGKYADHLSEENLFKETKKPHLMLNRKGRGLFRKNYTFVITAVNSQGTESWPSESIIIKIKE